jgi:hypothetical protein
MSGKIYIVGTCHYDLDGASRLEHILQKVKPDIIALEMTDVRAKPFENETIEYALDEVLPYINEWCSEKEKEFEASPQLFEQEKQGLNLSPRQLAHLQAHNDIQAEFQGFELITSRQYTKANPSVRLEYIDYPEGDEEKLSQIVAAKKEAFKEAADTRELVDVLLEAAEQSIEDYVLGCRSGVAQIYANLKEIHKIFEEGKKNSHSNKNEFFRFLYNPERDNTMSAKARQLYLESPESSMVVIVGAGHFPYICEALEDLKPISITLDKYESI